MIHKSHGTASPMRNDSRNNILLVANYPSDVGYAWWLMESYWVTLAEHFSKSRNVLLAYPAITTIPVAIAVAPIQVVERDFTNTSFISVLRQCLFLKRSAVHTIYFTDQHDFHWRYLFFRLAGVRNVIVHDHTPGLKTRPRGLKRVFKILFHRLPFVSSDALLGASDFVRNRLIHADCVPARKCFTVPNGLPAVTSTDARDVHSEFHIGKERRIVVGTGRAHEYKGVRFALCCVHNLVFEQGRSDLHYLFCGDGPHLSEFKRLARDLGVDKYVTFPGHCNNIPNILRGCDFAFHPSCGEVGYSLSILECMQAGLAVIVPDNPSVCGATEHAKTGLIYRDGDVESASLAIASLLDSPERAANLGKCALQLVNDRFILSSAHHALLDVFASIGVVVAPTGQDIPWRRDKVERNNRSISHFDV
jgi:glycosyltransferase involved in cell wall biosynthesis